MKEWAGPLVSDMSTIMTIQGPTHKAPNWLGLVEMDALLQAGQTVDPEREMHAMMGAFRIFDEWSAECVNWRRSKILSSEGL